jgi:hypothetical protein
VRDAWRGPSIFGSGEELGWRGLEVVDGYAYTVAREYASLGLAVVRLLPRH